MKVISRIAHLACGSIPATSTRRVRPSPLFSDSAIGIYFAEMAATPCRSVSARAPNHDIGCGMRTLLNDEQLRRRRFVRHHRGTWGSADHRSHTVRASHIIHRTVGAQWDAMHWSGY